MDIRVQLNDTLSKGLQGAMLAGADLTRPMAEVAELMVEVAQERFDTRIGPDGAPWKRSQRAIDDGDAPPTLTLTGQLRRQIVPNYGRDFAEAGVLKSAGPGVYARIHQLGGIIRAKFAKALSFGGRLLASVTMPARPYLGLSTAQKREVETILQRHLQQAFQGGGAG